MSDNSRILLQIEGEDKVYEFLNIISIFKNNEIYQYKIILKGALKKIMTLSENTVFDSIEGIIKKGDKKKKFKGNIEISYHKDGNVTFKDLGENPKFANIRPMKKHKAMSRLKKPNLFLRMSGIKINKLKEAKKPYVQDECNIIIIEKPLNKGYLTFDFYLSGSKYLKINAELKMAETQKTYSFVNQNETVSLHLHCYKTKNEIFCLVIPETGVLYRIKQYCLYWKYKVIKFFKQIQ